MDSINEVKEVLGTKRTPRKSPSTVVNNTPAEYDNTAVETAVNKVVDKTVDKTVDTPKESSLQSCNTCRNFGSYPSLKPCIHCCNNPYNQHSYYQK